MIIDNEQIETLTRTLGYVNHYLWMKMSEVIGFFDPFYIFLSIYEIKLK